MIYAYAMLASKLESIVRAARPSRREEHRPREPLSDYLEGLVKIKNENPYKTLDSIAESQKDVSSGSHLKNAYDLYFDMYRADKVQTKFARYDSSISPDEMKKEIVGLYRSSKDSLKVVAEKLSDKYGMNISTSTISRYARKELGVSSRQEAKLLRNKELSEKYACVA